MWGFLSKLGSKISFSVREGLTSHSHLAQIITTRFTSSGGVGIGRYESVHIATVEHKHGGSVVGHHTIVWESGINLENLGIGIVSP